MCEAETNEKVSRNGRPLGEDGVGEALRLVALRLLSSLPELTGVIRKLTPGETFRVVLSAKNAHLFQMAADGTHKPYLRDAGRFVENVDLVRVGPDFAGAVLNLSLMMNMAMIAARLDAIERELTCSDLQTSAAGIANIGVPCAR